MPHLTPVFILIATFGGIALIIYIVKSFRLRTKIVNAGKLDLEPRQVKALFENIELSKTTSLKWGLVLLCGGLGLILINLIDANLKSTLPWGIEIVALSLGYLVYYALTKDKESGKE